MKRPSQWASGQASGGSRDVAVGNGNLTRSQDFNATEVGIQTGLAVYSDL